MDTNERDIERAEAFEALSRDHELARIQSALATPGTMECQSCGDDIEPARLAALPSARRCIGCQTLLEGGAACLCKHLVPLWP